MASMLEPEKLTYDVVIIGAGAASLSASIKLKQENSNITIAIVEKGSEVGAHIISGAVFDATALDRLLPNWRTDSQNTAHNPVNLKVKQDDYCLLTKSHCFKLPAWLVPKYLSNANHYIVSLGLLCRYLAKQAADLGVDIYPAFPAKRLLFNEANAVIGVELNDFGLDRAGQPTQNFMPGAHIYSKYLIIGEGAKGSIAREAIEHFELDAGRAAAKYALGIKEIWRISPAQHKLGKIEHFISPSFPRKAYGGGFVYHIEDEKISIGFVTQLDYKQALTSPYQLFENFKSHKKLQTLLANGERIAYGAKAISCGGWYSIPKLTFKGGVLIGCSAGLLNGARMKGIHNAINSGIDSAIYIAKAIKAGRQHDEVEELTKNWLASDVARDLYPARNFKYLWQRFGLIIAVFDIWWRQFFKDNFFKDLSKAIANTRSDHQRLKFSNASPNATSNVTARYKATIAEALGAANLTHEDNQPKHLHIKNTALQYESELRFYGGPSALYCPAGVYEWQEIEGKSCYIINAQNCLHCKTCEIKDPNQNIRWQCPQGGSGPNYTNM